MGEEETKETIENPEETLSPEGTEETTKPQVSSEETEKEPETPPEKKDKEYNFKVLRNELEKQKKLVDYYANLAKQTQTQPVQPPYDIPKQPFPQNIPQTPLIPTPTMPTSFSPVPPNVTPTSPTLSKDITEFSPEEETQIAEADDPAAKAKEILQNKIRAYTDYIYQAQALQQPQISPTDIARLIDEKVNEKLEMDRVQRGLEEVSQNPEFIELVKKHVEPTKDRLASFWNSFYVFGENAGKVLYEVLKALDKSEPEVAKEAFKAGQKQIVEKLQQRATAPTPPMGRVSTKTEYTAEDLENMSVDEIMNVPPEIIEKWRKGELD
ncbi:MAG: hypothetical protein ACTSSF_00110 [Candidatus Heimdallarchaeaceae archaeon]